MSLEDKLQNPEPDHQQVEEAIEILRRLHEIRRVAVKRGSRRVEGPEAAEAGLAREESQRGRLLGR